MSPARQLTTAAAVLAFGLTTLVEASAAWAQCTSGHCTIGGFCFRSGDGNPVNVCEVCLPTTNPTGWTPVSDTTPCDDGLFCTVADSCTSGTCGGLPRSCNDFAACSTDSCDEAADACRYAIQAGRCLIGGTCMTQGTTLLSDPCWICDTARSTQAFSVNAGASCNDGRYCTVDDTCDPVGKCVVVTQRSCDDRLACTSDLCDESADACTHAVALDWCVIDGRCRQGGEPNPTSSCESCQPDTSDAKWLPVAQGTACGAAVCSAGMLTAAAACDGAGACAAGTTASCPSGRCADPFTCLGPCAADADCPAAAFCLAGACLNDRSAGQPCTHPGQCLSNHCADGVCCERACDDLCEACGAAGLCRAHAVGTDPDDECSGTDVCSGTRACLAAPGSVDASLPGGEAVDGSFETTPVPEAAVDGAAGVDGGRPGSGEGGCGCRVSPITTDLAPPCLLFAWAGALVTTRRRRRDRRV